MLWFWAANWPLLQNKRLRLWRRKPNHVLFVRNLIKATRDILHWSKKSQAWNTWSFPSSIFAFYFRSAAVSLDKTFWWSSDNTRQLPLPKWHSHPMIPWWFVLPCYLFLSLWIERGNLMQSLTRVYPAYTMNVNKDV